MSFNCTLKTVNLIKFDIVFLCQFKNRWVKITPVVMINTRKHMMTGLEVKTASENVHQVWILREWTRCLYLVAVPEFIHIFGIFNHQVIYKVTNLSHKHELPRVDS